jgi:hypothetical protein
MKCTYTQIQIQNAKAQRTHLEIICFHLLMLVPLVDFSTLEDGGDTFLQNIGSHKIYMAPHSRRWHSSSLYLVKHIDSTSIIH